MLPLLACAALLPQARPGGPIITPYWKRDKLAVSALRVPAEVARYSVFELAPEVSATFDNPFDPADVALEARVTPPSGKVYAVPGFFSWAYSRELKQGKETLVRQGEPGWRVRLCPTEEGRHVVSLTLRDRTGAVTTRDALFRATPSADPGFVRVSPRDHKYFEFDSGAAYYPVGVNAAWASGRGTYDYDDWLSAYGRAGVNLARLWLSPSWTTFALETPGTAAEGKGIGQIDLANAWRLDYVVQRAKEHGVRLMLCIDSYNILRDRDAHPWWEKTPHNKDNGGPLRIWSDFWISSEMARAYKAKLRYLVARYGASPSVFAWEFWNEADLTRDFNPLIVRDWHRRMAKELRRIDPYSHPITTSFAATPGVKEVDQSAEIDFTQTHHYGSPDLAGTVVTFQSRKGSSGKPHFFGEIGADTASPRADEDREGMQIHDPMWASIATGSSGTAMPWWWDSYIHPKGLYPLFTAASKFVQGIDWPGEEFRQTSPVVGYQTQPAIPPRKDVVFANGPVSWNRSPYNRPRLVRVSAAGVEGPSTVAGIQHGLEKHPDKHNPITFAVNLPQKTTFIVEVGDVSGHGGAALSVKLNGKRVVHRVFADPDGTRGTATLKQYAKGYSLTIPAGRHRITVENTGADWFLASYRFVGLVPRKTPPILAWGIVGNETVVAWVRHEARSWRRIIAMKDRNSPTPASVLGMAGLAAGQWQAEVWDTWRGEILRTRTVTVRNNGTVRVELPRFDRDLAVKLRRLGPSRSGGVGR